MGASPPGPGMTSFLLVDDHELMRQGVRQLLLALRPGATVTEAGTADEALASIRAARVDLVLLDLGLKGRSGFDLLSDLHREWPEQLVLVLSGYTEVSSARRALGSGARGYVSKTSAAEELEHAVTRVLNGGHYVSPALAEALAADLESGPSGSPLESLSGRELEVLRLVATGSSLKEIAAQLHLSEKTVGTYRARLATKLGCSSNVELTRIAMVHGLID